MPKSVPKQKPLATKKKKVPMSILGLLGLALVLVGIVAAIGLTQINQDGRSNASEKSQGLIAFERAVDKANVENAETKKEDDKKQAFGLEKPQDVRITLGDKKSDGMRKVRISWKQKNGKYYSKFSFGADRLDATCSEQEDLRTNPEKGTDGWFCQLSGSRGDLNKEVSARSCSSGGSCTAEMNLKRGASYDIWVRAHRNNDYTFSEHQVVTVN